MVLLLLISKWYWVKNGPTLQGCMKSGRSSSEIPSPHLPRVLPMPTLLAAFTFKDSLLRVRKYIIPVGKPGSATFGVFTLSVVNCTARAGPQVQPRRSLPNALCSNESRVTVSEPQATWQVAHNTATGHSATSAFVHAKLARQGNACSIKGRTRDMGCCL